MADTLKEKINIVLIKGSIHPISPAPLLLLSDTKALVPGSWPFEETLAGKHSVAERRK